MANTYILNGRHEAAEIVEALTIAYWLDDVNSNRRDYHVRNAHENFVALAKQLGYRVEKIEREDAA